MSVRDNALHSLSDGFTPFNGRKCAFCKIADNATIYGAGNARPLRSMSQR
jgi:hypothetical protein